MPIKPPPHIDSDAKLKLGLPAAVWLILVAILGAQIVTVLVMISGSDQSTKSQTNTFESCPPPQAGDPMVLRDLEGRCHPMPMHHKIKV